MRYVELTELTDAALVHRSMDLERELTTALFRHRMGRLENVGTLKQKRRDIARVHTAITTREHAANTHRGALRSIHGGSFVPSATAASAGAGESFLQSILDKPEAAE